MMRIAIAEVIRKNLLETLADLEHKQWMAWAKNILKNEDISADREKRWKTLFVPYKDLSEESKDQDREYARKVMRLLKEE